MKVVAFETCRGVALERFLSDFLSCLSGEKVRVISSGGEIAFDADLAWITFACGSVDFAMSLDASNQATLPLNRDRLANFTWKGVQVGEIRDFRLAAPSFAQCFNLIVYRESAWRCYGRLLVSGVSLFNLASSTVEDIHGTFKVRGELIVEDVTDLLNGSVCSQLVAILNFIGVASYRVEVGMEDTSTILSVKENKQSHRLGLEVCLGVVEIALDELLSLRSGTKLCIERQEIFEGYLRLAGSKFARVEISFEEHGVSLSVKDLEVMVALEGNSSVIGA